jgi:glutamate-1-semialdehyde aminotransferase
MRWPHLTSRFCEDELGPYLLLIISNSIVYFFSQTAVDLIHCEPDIACYGKLMTGGMIPLAATIATDAVFDSFIGDSKVY